MKWKILACDLDGTLIGWNHKINDRDLDALRRARNAGMHVAICTGRNSRECAGVVQALELTGLGVCVNGGMVCDMANGRAVHTSYVAPDVAHEITTFFGTRGHATLVLVEDENRLPTYLRTDHAPPHRATTDWLLYNRVDDREVTEIPREAATRVVRLGIVVNPDQAAPLHAAVQQQFGTRCTSHSIYSPHYDCQIIELFPPNVNKWTGLVHLAEAMSLPPETIVTIGDDINDLPMLRGASLSFAMGNAVDEVQKAAKCLTGPQKDCGVAQVIDKLLAACDGKTGPET